MGRGGGCIFHRESSEGGQVGFVHKEVCVRVSRAGSVEQSRREVRASGDRQHMGGCLGYYSQFCGVRTVTKDSLTNSLW